MQKCYSNSTTGIKNPKPTSSHSAGCYWNFWRVRLAGARARGNIPRVDSLDSACSGENRVRNPWYDTGVWLECEAGSPPSLNLINKPHFTLQGEAGASLPEAALPLSPPQEKQDRFPGSRTGSVFPAHCQRTLNGFSRLWKRPKLFLLPKPP